MNKHFSTLMSRLKGMKAGGGKPEIIAITGNGTAKTVIAHMLCEVLRENGHKVALLAGDELDQKLDATNELDNFVASSKRAKAEFAIVDIIDDLIPQLSDKTPITMAIMAPISFEKPTRHGEVDEPIKARFRLFEGEPKFIVLNRDDRWYENFDEFIAQEIKISYGKDALANVKIEDSTSYKKGSEAHLTMDGSAALEVATYATDKLSDYCMAATAAAASLLDVDTEVIQEGIANYEP